MRDYCQKEIMLRKDWCRRGDLNPYRDYSPLDPEGQNSCFSSFHTISYLVILPYILQIVGLVLKKNKINIQLSKTKAGSKMTLPLQLSSCTLQITIDLIHAMFQVESLNYEWPK